MTEEPNFVLLINLFLCRQCCHIFPLSKNCRSSDLDITLGQIAISIIFQLIVQPHYPPTHSPIVIIHLSLCHNYKAEQYRHNFSAVNDSGGSNIDCVWVSI